MNTLLAEQLKSIIDGPLVTGKVIEDLVADRVGMVRQNEKRHVFGVVVSRDGEDQYFVNDGFTPISRRRVIEAVKVSFGAKNHFLTERADQSEIDALHNFQKTVDDGERKIGKIFKRIAKHYAERLSQMTGAKWKTVTASETILSFDSDEIPKRAVDIYWEYDPVLDSASVFIEGPKGKQKVYTRQKLADLSRKNYIKWLSDTLKEDVDIILELALNEDFEIDNKEEELPLEADKVEVDTARQSLVEELKGIVDEAAMVSYRQSMRKTKPVGTSSKPKIVSSGTKVGKLFKRLVKALTQGGDWDGWIKALRKEGVPEKHITYAIKHKTIPYVYAEDVEFDELDEFDDEDEDEIVVN